MRRMGISVLIVIGFASGLWAQSVVDLTPALGGDNHAAQIVLNPPYYPPFTPGSTADDQTYIEGQVITWEVRLGVSGTHNRPGDVGYGLATNGVAAFTFSLELHVGTADGPLADVGAGSATSRGWFSTAKAGVNAAFCSSFNVGGLGTLGGHVYDPPALGGPGLNQFEYPSTSGRPAQAWTVPGKLSTIGAVTYMPSGQALGVGVAPGEMGGGAGGFGALPLCEGQINTTGLSPGIYVLKVIPQPVMLYRGDFDCSGPPPDRKSMVRAQQLNGGTITFELLPDLPPQLVSAVSVKQHGTVGEFAIDLPLDAEPLPGVECRKDGPTKFVLTFSEPVQPASGGAQVQVSAGTLDAFTFDGAQMTVTLHGVPDETCLALSLNGLVDSADQPLVGVSAIGLLALKADINGDGHVDILDTEIAKANSGAALDASTFRSDLNLDGAPGGADISMTKAYSGHVPPCVPDPGPWLYSVVSSKTQGPSVFELLLPTNAPLCSIVECRSGGPTNLQLWLSEPIQAIDGIIDTNEVTASTGTVSSVTVLGPNWLSVELSGVPNGPCVLGLTGVTDKRAHPLATPDSLTMCVQFADVNADLAVDGADVAAISAVVGQSASYPTNFLYDLNLDGVINSLDVDLATQAAAPPTLVSATSWRQHGTEGEYGIDLPLAGTPGVECRNLGPTKLVFTFSKPVRALDGQPDGNEVSLSAGTLGTVTMVGSTMTITLADVPDETCLAVALTGIVDWDGHTLAGDNDVAVWVLKGDVVGDGHVDIVDVDEVKARQSLFTWNPAHFRDDVDLSGRVNSTDIVLVKALEGNVVPCITDPGPWLYSAVSRMVHGSTGYEIALPLNTYSGAAVECRSGSPQLVLRFSEPIAATDGVPDSTEVHLSAGDVTSASILTDTLTIDTANVPDQTWLVVTLSGLTDLNGTPLAGSDYVVVGMLLGDADGSYWVNANDVNLISAAQGLSLGGTNFRYDLDRDGSIGTTDVNLATANSGHQLPE